MTDPKNLAKLSKEIEESLSKLHEDIEIFKADACKAVDDMTNDQGNDQGNDQVNDQGNQTREHGQAVIIELSSVTLEEEFDRMLPLELENKNLRKQCEEAMFEVKRVSNLINEILARG